MSKRLLYLFGEPGTGKITVARELQKRLINRKLFWLHDLDSVCAIVGRYPLPRLMDQISLAVLEELMNGEMDIIYVRPSRDLETVERVLYLANAKDYVTYLVRLTASVDTLVHRVTARGKSEFRISSMAELNRYFQARPPTSYNLPLKHTTICTENKTVAQVADEIQKLLGEQND